MKVKKGENILICNSLDNRSLFYIVAYFALCMLLDDYFAYACCLIFVHIHAILCLYSCYHVHALIILLHDYCSYAY